MNAKHNEEKMFTSLANRLSYPRWAKELRSSITTEEEKPMFDEVVRIFCKGFLRSAYILTWIMISEALRTRIKHAADAGEKQAQQCEDKIQKQEKAEQSVDNTIMDAANELSIVAPDDFKYIKTFWAMRCIYAHPYEKTPTKEEVRFIISQSVEIVLSRPIYHRKPFIDQEINNLLIAHYLPNEEKSVRLQARRVLSRIGKDLFPYFFKCLLFQIGQVKDDTSKFKIACRIRYYVLELVCYCSEEIKRNDNKYRLEYYANNFPRELVIGVCSPNTWKVLPKRIQGMLVDFMSDTVSESYSTISPTNIFVELSEQNALSEEQNNKFREPMSTISFFELSNFLPLSGILADAMIRVLKSANYNKIIPVVSYIENITIEEFSKIDNVRLLEIGREIISNAFSNSWACQGFVRNIPERLVDYPEPLLAGIFLGQLFPYDSEYSPRTEYLKHTIWIVEERIDNDALRHWQKIFSSNYKTKTQRLEDIYKDLAGIAGNDSLKERLKILIDAR